MSITQSSELVTAIGDWQLRSDMGPRIPTFIQLAEARMKRDDRVRRLARASFPVDAGEETISGLTDFRGLESITLEGDQSAYGELEVVAPGDLSRYREIYGPTGTPRVVAVVGDNILFAPIPDREYTFTLTYWQGFTPLTDDESTNWVLTEHPDAYLFGALSEVAPYMKDDERIPVWVDRFQVALEEMRLAQVRMQFGGGAMVRRPTNPIP